MAAILAPIRWVGSLMSPTRPAAPPAEQPEPQPQSSTITTPTPDTTSRPPEQDDFDEYQPTPKSLFSDKASNYLPGSKRKFELDFESPKTAKKTKLDAMSSSKRKRENEFETPQKKNKTQMLSQTMPQIPRSAMKPRFQVKTPTTALKKNVTFNRDPLTGTRPVRAQFGKSGYYCGSIFADVSPVPFTSPEGSPSTSSIISDTSSSISISPSTKANTNANTPGPRTVPAFIDPHDPYWRPQPHNPRPGQFCLPNDLSIYDDDDDESMIDQSTTPQSDAGIGGNIPTTPETIRKGYNTVFPESPETPRMSHAHLPGSSPQSTPAITSTYPTQSKYSHSTPAMTGNHFAEVDTDAVNKARAAAEKYKPESVGKQASKLSQVTQARSRSSSPPGSTPPTPGHAINPVLAAPDLENMAQAQQNGLGNSGNMLSNDYEQKVDDWARNLDWPQPGQKIAEEEVFKSDMMGFIVKEWTDEDDEQSETFWDREFDRVVEAGRRAEREDKVLMFV